MSLLDELQEIDEELCQLKTLNTIDEIIKVKDAYFKNGIKIKPKNLGLTSLYRGCIKKINFRVAKQLI